jgi:hypothetical protein
MKTIQFDSSSKETVLKIFDKQVDAEGYIIESATNERVLSPDGFEVTLKDFAGIRKGSELIFTRDLPSLINYAQDLDTK